LVQILITAYFFEERITTYFVDQTDTATSNELKINLRIFHLILIIDDGLHHSQANLNTANFALGLLKPNGVLLSKILAYQIFNITRL